MSQDVANTAKCQEIAEKIIEHYSRENLGILEAVAHQIYATGKCALVHIYWDDEEQTIKMSLVAEQAVTRKK